MSEHPNIGDAFIAEVARQVADLLRPVLLEELRARVAASVSAPRYATGKKNPFGSREVFMAHARAGAFRTFRHGREVAAEWAEAEAVALTRTPPKRTGGRAVAQGGDGELSRDELREMLKRATPKARRKKA